MIWTRQFASASKTAKRRISFKRWSEAGSITTGKQTCGSRLSNPRQVLLSEGGQFRALRRPFILVDYEVVLIGAGRLRMVPLAEVCPIGLGYGAGRDVVASLGFVMAAAGDAIAKGPATMRGPRVS